MKIFDAGGEATGIIAIGGIAQGFLAIGGVATGVIAIGQISRGCLAIGQVAVGLFAVGQLSVSVYYNLGQLALGGRVHLAQLELPCIPDFKDTPENLLLEIAQFIGWFLICMAVWFISVLPVIKLFVK